MLFDELSQNGFNILKVYSNTCGDELKPESHSIALICQKKYWNSKSDVTWHE